MSPDIFESMSQFGVAGIMGMLWVWERFYSRKREQELSASHARIMADQQVFTALVELLQQNTRALERFENTQKQLIQHLEKVHHDITHRAA